MKEAVEEIHSLMKNITDRIEAQTRESESLRKSQQELTESVNVLSTKLLDPEHGLIVKVNQNVESHQRLAQQFTNYNSIVQEVNTLTKWRKGATKVFWLIITAMIAYFSDIFKK